MALWEARVIRRALWVFLFACLLPHASHAQGSGQYVTIFDANGKIVSGVTPGGASSTLFNVENGTWGAATGPGNAARVTVDRAVGFGAAEGAAVEGSLLSSIATEFTGAALAKAGLRLAMGGLAGLAVGAALDVAMKNAHIAPHPGVTTGDLLASLWDYNPLPTPGPPSGGWWLGSLNTSPTPAHNGDPATAMLDQGHSTPGCHLVAGIRYGNYDAKGQPLAAYSKIQCTDPDGSIGGVADVSAGYNYGTGPSSGMTCPNGVTFNDTNKCLQVIDFGTANIYLQGQINGSNGPAIGQNVVGGNGVQLVPSTGLTNSPNSIDFDSASWPTVSTPPTSTFGPKTETTNSTTKNPDGSTTTTGVTTTKQTDLANKVSGSAVTTTVTNTTNVTTCTTPGSCTTTTTVNSPGGGTKPAEDVKVCGLPSTPACKIDETGTADAAKDALATAKTTGDAVDAWKSKLDATAGGGGAAGLGIGGLADFTPPTEHGAPGGLGSILPDGGSCSPLATTWGSRSLTFDYCPLVNYTKPIIDWFAACLTAFTIWGLWVGRARAPQGG